MYKRSDSFVTRAQVGVYKIQKYEKPTLPIDSMHYTKLSINRKNCTQGHWSTAPPHTPTLMYTPFTRFGFTFSTFWCPSFRHSTILHAISLSHTHQPQVWKMPGEAEGYSTSKKFVRKRLVSEKHLRRQLAYYEFNVCEQKKKTHQPSSAIIESGRRQVWYDYDESEQCGHRLLSLLF